MRVPFLRAASAVSAVTLRVVSAWWVRGLSSHRILKLWAQKVYRFLDERLKFSYWVAGRLSEVLQHKLFRNSGKKAGKLELSVFSSPSRPRSGHGYRSVRS